ncbi:hypothetical protein [Flavobacterium suncheonense]|uniref:Uncharacterized protein n=1 Tax=Flavobacterium suncheonense GH29-5 = DSM 17707 TaxID=1121899 RepID=A0A0A2M5K1_9FLAO|nr:hypothetical protein [Flavobacterium suncheonense]KGO86693.1 hypothetical protein Q764_13565 [Flavobacterium suncheonense GH29-5 = DSM 17707]
MEQPTNPDNLGRPFVENVEGYFSEFVEFVGGKIIEKLENNLSDRPNADYIFENPDVIAELKCFQKDVFSDSDDFPKLERLYEKWFANKSISQTQFRKIVFQGGPLPEKCIADLIEIASKTIERAIYKANKQIQESKSTFEKKNANGILFLINDGNYFFNTQGFITIISNVLARKFSNPSFDVCIYITINQVTQKPGSDFDYTYWVPIYTRIDKNGETVQDENLFNFVNSLGENLFGDFFTFKTGQVCVNRSEIENLENGWEEMKKHQFVPKEIVYKK